MRTTLAIPGGDAVNSFLARVGLNLMFKPVFGWTGEGIRHKAEKINILSLDSSRLEAYLRRCTAKSAKGIVILCHPFLKYGWRYFERAGYVQALLDEGYDVVLFNFKGFGTSQVSGSLFADDVTATVSWARAFGPSQTIHVMGLSFGGYHALQALGSLAPGSLDSLVLDSVPLEVDRFFKSGLVAWMMRRLSTSRWSSQTGTRPLGPLIKELTQVPMMLFCGGSDALLNNGDLTFLRSLPHVRLTVVKGCGHLEAFKKCQGQYLAALFGFFKGVEHDRKINAIRGDL